MTTTRIKLTGPVRRDAVQTVDLTPSWAGIMPAIIAALQHGTPAGQAMARGELERLALEVDSANNRARREREEEPKPPAGQVSHLKTATAALAGTLKGRAEEAAEDMAEEETAVARAYQAGRAFAFHLAAGDALARGGNPPSESYDAAQAFPCPPPESVGTRNRNRRLTLAIQRAIELHESAHHGDADAALTNAAEAMAVLRDALPWKDGDSDPA